MSIHEMKWLASPEERRLERPPGAGQTLTIGRGKSLPATNMKAATPMWLAKMIGPENDAGEGGPAYRLVRNFTVTEIMGSELLRVSALGMYRAFLNGNRVGHDVLTPGWTTYDARISYQSYSVAELLQVGENTLEIWIADGWYRAPLMWIEERRVNVWGTKIGAIAEVRRGADLEDMLLATDESWSSGETAIRKSQLYFGEIYDATHRGTASAGVVALDFNTQLLLPHECAPVQELPPLSVAEKWQDDEGRWIYDFGQNTAGYVRLSASSEGSSEILVEHAETLDELGQFYNENYRTAEAILALNLDGNGVLDYSPSFTFQGFRYARVSVKGNASVTRLESIPISSLPVATAAFSCSNPLVNRLVENAIWSQRSNFLDVPIDCPQRDERLGYSGDAQVFAATSCYLADSHDILVKFLRDLMVDQAPDGAISHTSPHVVRVKPGKRLQRGSTGWGDAITIIPWRLYLHYGDTDILAETLPAMERWIDFVWSLVKNGIVRPPAIPGTRGYCLGDWLQPKSIGMKALPTIGDDAAATLYLFISLSIAEQTAKLVGSPAQVKRFADMREEVHAAFANEFVTPSGRLVYDDQTSYALALLHDLVPADKIPGAVKFFRNAVERTGGRLGTGFIGTPALLPALSKVGAGDLAAQLLLQEELPGWLYQVKMGATTIWERWDSIQPDGRPFDPEMNSLNHYAFGAVCEWFFESLGGFRPDPEAPGFENIVFSPTIVPSLSPVSAHYDSVRGRISASWELEGERVTYRVVVPEGSSGTLRLPPAYENVLLNGKAIPQNAKLPAGAHTITFAVSA
ncbi:family 78 glycoside hydrolase catalytic domain [Devosia sp. LjRoot3]|uniref:family 78 glycoside hydrolase catalytic domain n=1 Tax=Devosia sp. LjRoot3 TaxID=3342319 RepID=UPI003ECFF34E